MSDTGRGYIYIELVYVVPYIIDHGRSHRPSRH